MVKINEVVIVLSCYACLQKSMSVCLFIIIASLILVCTGIN